MAYRVHRQFNSPINLYSPQNVAEALERQSTVLANGAIGIDFHLLAAPNLAKSEVLKMLEEEEPGEPQPPVKRLPGNVEWPPKFVIKQSPSFFARCGSQGLKRVAWPPPPENVTVTGLQAAQQEAAVYINGHSQSPAAARVVPPWENETSPNPIYQQHHLQQPPAQILQTPPPTTITLRPSAPINQPPAPVYTTQPAVKRQTGVGMRGDEKWPPVSVKAQEAAALQQETARGPAVKPRLVRKDYRPFFAQNALNPTYPSYKAPPGTQHYTEEGTSNL